MFIVTALDWGEMEESRATVARYKNLVAKIERPRTGWRGNSVKALGLRDIKRKHSGICIFSYSIEGRMEKGTRNSNEEKEWKIMNDQAHLPSLGVWLWLWRLASESQTDEPSDCSDSLFSLLLLRFIFTRSLSILALDRKDGDGSFVIVHQPHGLSPAARPTGVSGDSPGLENGFSKQRLSVKRCERERENLLRYLERFKNSKTLVAGRPVSRRMPDDDETNRETPTYHRRAMTTQDNVSNGYEHVKRS